MYEQIIFELIESRDFDTARTILRQSKALAQLKLEQPDRYLRIERLLTKMRSLSDDSNFENSLLDEIYQDFSKVEKRKFIADSICKELTEVPPSRLVNLISQSLKWQQLRGLLPPGSKFDLFQGIASGEMVEIDSYPTELERTIKFGKKSFPECAIFSPDGQFFVTGSVDGFIEVWNYLTGKLNTDLKYQQEVSFSNQLFLIPFQ